MFEQFMSYAADKLDRAIVRSWDRSPMTPMAEIARRYGVTREAVRLREERLRRNIALDHPLPKIPDRTLGSEAHPVRTMKRDADGNITIKVPVPAAMAERMEKRARAMGLRGRNVLAKQLVVGAFEALEAAPGGHPQKIDRGARSPA